MRNEAIQRLLHVVAYAIKAHGTQVRKESGMPYIQHPINVALRVAALGYSDEVVAAAILHDVLEDTTVTPGDMFFDMGMGVTHLVEEVSDVSKPEDGNRATRKALDRAHLAKSSPEGATIKLADMLDNLSDILTWTNDTGFIDVYIAEMELLLPLLAHGHGRLWQEANARITQVKEERCASRELAIKLTA